MNIINYSPYERDVIESIDVEDEDEYETDVEVWIDDEEAQRMSIEAINLTQLILDDIVLSHSPTNVFERMNSERMNSERYLQNGDELIETCSICLDDVTDVETTSKLSCGHHFHTNCIKLCLERSRKCPLCRRIIN
jgi:hypothetical protein